MVLTPSLAVFRDGMFLASVLTLLRMSARSMATGGWQGGRAEDLLRRVGLDFVRGAVASASERTYLG